MASRVGEVLTRSRKRKDGWDCIRVTGHINDVLVVERAKSFGPSKTISAAELARDYGAEFEAVESEHALGRRLDAEANDRHAQDYFRGKATPPASPPEGSPEHAFAAAAAQAQAQEADDANRD